MSVLSAEQSARFVDLLTLVPVLALVMWIAQIASLAIGKSVSITSEHEKSAEKSADFFFALDFHKFSFFHNVGLTMRNFYPMSVVESNVSVVVIN